MQEPGAVRGVDTRRVEWELRAAFRLYRLVMLVESEFIQDSLRPRRGQVGADKRQGELHGSSNWLASLQAVLVDFCLKFRSAVLFRCLVVFCMCVVSSWGILWKYRLVQIGYAFFMVC